MKINAMTMLVGTAMVATLWVGPDPYVTIPDCTGFMQTDDPAAICYDGGRTDAEQTVKDAQEPYRILAAQEGHDCSPVSAWAQPALRDRIPTWAVMKKLDGEIVGLPFDQAWKLATAGDAWTLRLCEDTR